MTLGDDVRDRLILLGGQAAGVDCPDCPFESREVDLGSHPMTAVACPECGTTILTAEERLGLRQAGKL